jgi:hypothetical protein
MTIHKHIQTPQIIEALGYTTFNEGGTSPLPATHSGFNGLGGSYRENSFRARHSHIQIVKERVELPSPKKRINVFWAKRNPALTRIKISNQKISLF